MSELNIRIIPRLDIKSGKLIKGINLEGLRVIGDPLEAALRYFKQGADEIFIHDAVASLYNQNHLGDLLEKITDKIFIPVTAGGGIRNRNDAIQLFNRGADKISINTAFVSDINLVSDLVNLFGSQSIVGSIETKKVDHNRYEIFTESGREKTGIELNTWIKKLIEYGIGEIILTSIEHEGARKGFDLDLAKYIDQHSSVPILFGGGFKSPSNLSELIKVFTPQGITIADYLHYGKGTINDIKVFGKSNSIKVRL